MSARIAEPAAMVAAATVAVATAIAAPTVAVIVVVAHEPAAIVVFITTAAILTFPALASGISSPCRLL